MQHTAVLETGGQQRAAHDGEAPTHPRLWLAALLVCAVAAVLVFVLPLHIPMDRVETISTSYVVGFNNRVAIAGAAGLSVVVLLLTLWLNRAGAYAVAFRRERRLPPGLIAGVVMASAAVLGVCGWLVAASHLRYLGDAGYIIEQATVRQATGRALYTQMDFAYGPLLLFPEIWLSELLHCSITAAYYLTLVLESTLGLLLLAYVLNELPIAGNIRRWAFVLLALGAITPHLGLNYTYLRFLSPVAFFLFATRGRSVWQAALLLCAGEALELLISPELGMAMAVGVVWFGLLRAWQQGLRWLVVAVLPLAVLATLLLTLGRPFLQMAKSLSHGTLNLPAGPYPHILVLVFAVVWLIPVGLGRLVRSGEAESARLLAAYAIGLAFLPAALGRSDPLHVIFNGVTLLLLSLVAVSAASARMRTAWLVAIAVLVLWNQFVNQRFFQMRTAEVVRESVLPRLSPGLQAAVRHLAARKNAALAKVLNEESEASYRMDVSALERVVGSGLVATPLEVNPAVEAELQATHHSCPGYYAFWADMMSPAAERRSIADVDACPWMLLPGKMPEGDMHAGRSLAALQGLNLPYRERNALPYIAGDLFRNEMRAHWVAVQPFGPYTLYRQVCGAAR